MIDFAPIRERKELITELAKILTPEDLRYETNQMIDTMCDLIADCQDFDVFFEPYDPEAYDSAAETAEEVQMSWTLGHVIVHVTASAEESAYLAAELARGVRYRRLRSRYEVPWQSITTIEQCRHRLEESRRMRLASLDMWPDIPFLENTYTLKVGAPAAITDGHPEANAIVRFLIGLLHDDSHLGQIAEIVQQARLARGQ
jgi:cytosine/adenosine deaminase-related metal-dependent hydrolase